MQIKDMSDGVAYQASNIVTPLVNITGLNNDQQYRVRLWASNGVDTNYNVYTALFTIMPNPIPVASLASPSQSAQQIMIQWTYETAVYSIDEFVLNVADVNVLGAGYAIIEANAWSSSNGDIYTYNFILNRATVNLPSLATSDNLILSIYAINTIGEVSPISNVLVLN